jgi:hypothetical protein
MAMTGRYRAVPSSPVGYQPAAADRGDGAAGGNHQPDQVTLLGFGGGMDRSAAPDLIPEGSCRFIQNGYYPREVSTLTTRPGLVAILAAAAAGALTGAYCHQDPDGNESIVVSHLNAEGDDQGLAFRDGAPAGSKTLKQIAAALGSTAPPAFRTFAGRLWVAVDRKFLRSWNGKVTPTTDPATVPSAASGTVTFEATLPTEDTPIVIGSRVYTFWAQRYAPGEVTIGANAEECAENLRAAIAEDSYDVSAAIDPGELNVVVVTATMSGEDGNTIPFSTESDSMTLSGDDLLAGGVEGLAFDEVSSFEAPQGRILTTDRFGRLMVAGDKRTGLMDRVYFSAPGVGFSWARGQSGDGESWDLGQLEGNAISALVPFADEILCHKAGQNREIHRMRVADPDPETWDMQTRFFTDTQAAVGPRSAASCGGLHVLLDRDWIGVFEASAAYDEIRAGQDGLKVHDLVDGVVRESAFMAVDPREGYLLIFPNAGRSALVFHYSTRRWASWQFSGSRKFTCACYSEALGKMLLGADDGMLYALDPDIATDAGLPFQTIIVSRSYGAGSLSQTIVKQLAVDFQHRVAGLMKVYVIPDRDEGSPQLLCERELRDRSLTLLAARTVTLVAARALGFAKNPYARVVEHYHATVETVALKIVLESGAITINSAAMRTASHGRAVGG